MAVADSLLGGEDRPDDDERGAIAFSDWTRVVDSLPEAVLAASEDNLIVHANAAAEALLGWGREELRGRPLTAIVPERFRDRHLASFQRFATSGKRRQPGQPLEVPALRRDGTEVPVEVLVGTVELSGQRLVVGMVREAGERIELQGIAQIPDLVLAALAEEGTLEGAFPRVLSALGESLAWDVVQLWMLDESRAALHQQGHWVAPGVAAEPFLQASHRTLQRGEGLPGRVWAEGRTVWIADFGLDPNFPRLQAAAAAGLRAGGAFPILSGHRTVGVIELISREPRAPSAELRSRLAVVGKELGHFIELVKAGEQSAALARTLQQSLLPVELPDVRGLDLAARYRPAGAGLEVGGDFYDVFRISRGSVGFAIGDVCGKGAPAASLTALVRYTLRTAAMQTRSPAQALSIVNAVMVRQQPAEMSGKFATVAYGALRRSRGVTTLTTASGGHPLPLVRRRDGTIEAVAEPGTLLGVFPTVQLHDHEVGLEPGDAVVFFTDGVIEARADAGLFGEERLRGVLLGTVGWAAADIAVAVEAAALDFQAGATGDDIAVLVVAIR